MSLEVPDYLQARVCELLNIEFNKISYEENFAVILKITPTRDGDKWVVLYGANLHDGVAGFGDTPWAAMRAFHDAMLSERIVPLGSGKVPL